MLRLCLRLQTETQQFTRIHGTKGALKELGDPTSWLPLAATGAASSPNLGITYFDMSVYPEQSFDLPGV